MSAQAEVIAPCAAPIAPLRVGGAELAQGRIAGTAALPFTEPFQFSCPAGLSLAEIVEGLFEAGLIERAWEPRLAVFVGDVRFTRESWGHVRPRPGRLVAVRAEPGFTAAVAAVGSIISSIFSWNFVAAIVIQVGLSAFVGAEGPAAQSFEQLKDIDASRNEFAPFRKVPVVLGRFRTFPPHAAKPYTIGEGERVILRMLLCWGVGPLAIDDELLKIGDTPIDEFSGVTVQHRLKPGDPWPTIFPSSVDEDDGPGLVENSEGWIARTTTSDQADKLQIEIAFHEGLYFRKGDGDIVSDHATLAIRYRADGATDWLSWETGSVATEGHEYTVTARQQKPWRKSFSRTVTRGRYEVAVKRVSPDPNPTAEQKGHNSFMWTKLRSFTFEQPVLDDNLAVTAIEIEAGDQLSGMVDLVNGVVTRLAPIWDDEEEEFGAAAESRNPAELFRWVATGPGAPKPRNPATEVDDATLGAWAELCTERGWKCDLEIRAGMGMDEVLDTIARCGRASRIEKNGKLSVVIDDVQPAPAQHFTPRNSWGFRSQRRYAAETHALRAQFNNEEKDYQRDEMMVYYPDFDAESAEIVRTVPMIGKTDPDEVYASAKRIIAEELLRPEDYAFRCDVEHLALKLGRRITVAHPVIAVGNTSARVKSLVLNEAETHVIALVLDEKVEHLIGFDYVLAWRRVEDEAISVEFIALKTEPTQTALFKTMSAFSDGALFSDGAHFVQGGWSAAIVTLAADGGLPIASAPKAGDLVTFGEADIAVIDAVVLNVTPSSDLEAEVLAQPYSPDLFSGDDEEVPPWSSNVRSDAFPAPPAPVIKGVAAATVGIFVDFDFPAASAHRVSAIEAYWKPVADTGERYELANVLPSAARVAAYPAGVRGRPYLLRLVAVGERGVRTAAEPVEVISGGETSGWTALLTRPSAVVATDANGSGGNYSSAGGVFRVFIGGVEITGEEGLIGYSLVSASSGLSIDIDAETGVYTITSLTEDVGEAVLRAHIISRDEDIDLPYAITKARAGTPGAPGDPPSGFVATIEVPASSTGVNLRTLAEAEGYTGFSDATITFEVDAETITGAPGAPNGGIGIDTGTWPTGDYTIALNLVIKSGGVGQGGGGKGGNSSAFINPTAGGIGGDAVYCRGPIDITVEPGGVLRAGGGGGGGGSRFQTAPPPETAWEAGGGGGGGRPNGPGGSGLNNGTAGSEGANGQGGDGGTFSGDGGDGGNFATAGETAGAAGGAAGYAIRKNGHTVNVTNNGTITGTVG